MSEESCACQKIGEEIGECCCGGDGGRSGDKMVERDDSLFWMAVTILREFGKFFVDGEQREAAVEGKNKGEDGNGGGNMAKFCCFLENIWSKNLKSKGRKIFSILISEILML